MQFWQKIVKPPNCVSSWRLPVGVFVLIASLSLLAYHQTGPAIPPIFSGDFVDFSSLLFASNDSKSGSSCSCIAKEVLVDEAALFREASRVSNCAATCTVDKGKLALLFLTRGPLPMAPLWARFLEGHEGLYSIYIHPKPGYEYSQNEFQEAQPFIGRQVPSEEVGWAALSELDAERRLLARALLDPLNQRFMLVSESCIPIRSFDYTYSQLMSQELTFLNSFDEVDWWAGRGRYVPQIFLPEVTLEQWRKGAQWFTATRHDANLIVGDIKYYSNYAAYCQAVPLCYPAEHYFPTLLYIEHAEGLANETMTFVDWSQGGAHPKTFFSQDLSPGVIRFIQGLVDCPHTGRTLQHGAERPCWLIMRKVAAESLNHLLSLSPDVLGY
ncbi:hypothetical protein KFL_001410180 [Klebsormidium nitens]|uniref:Core-2/I-branching beta-1,6-N-acetylglucosaminyltransferase family protein n=1 Tax=Klebsormidium nitens TaxID=105231 RepID=A0A0U9HS99_KLENI|nr:hypothetical protein KFL_001410180 [Klebsormidium nitens]|eukprot:GAQ83260.1 hypothetical protein KFL_001410180 [Klebsormidium nitens]